MSDGRNDTDLWNDHHLCGEVYLAGFPQWTEHTHENDSFKFHPFRIITVNLTESGVYEASLYPILSYYSAQEAKDWDGWGQFNSRSSNIYPGQRDRANGFRIAISNILLSELHRFPKLGHETVNEMNQDVCCDCDTPFVQRSICDSTSKFCNGLSSFWGKNLPCFRGRACSACARDWK